MAIADPATGEPIDGWTSWSSGAVRTGVVHPSALVASAAVGRGVFIGPRAGGELRRRAVDDVDREHGCDWWSTSAWCGVQRHVAPGSVLVAAAGGRGIAGGRGARVLPVCRSRAGARWWAAGPAASRSDGIRLLAWLRGGAVRGLSETWITVAAWSGWAVPSWGDSGICMGGSCDMRRGPAMRFCSFCSLGCVALGHPGEVPVPVHDVVHLHGDHLGGEIDGGPLLQGIGLGLDAWLVASAADADIERAEGEVGFQRGAADLDVVDPHERAGGWAATWMAR